MTISNGNGEQALGDKVSQGSGVLVVRIDVEESITHDGLEARSSCVLRVEAKLAFKSGCLGLLQCFILC